MYVEQYEKPLRRKGFILNNNYLFTNMIVRFTQLARIMPPLALLFRPPQVTRLHLRNLRPRNPVRMQGSQK